jgi:hypothetical protein
MSESRSAARASAASVLIAEATAAHVLEAFSRGDVPVLRIKGPSIGRWLYDTGEQRPVRDVDLFPAPDRLRNAERILKSLGFANRHDGISPPWAEEHAECWRAGPQQWTSVDLHRRIWGFGASASEVFERLWSEREVMRVGGREAQVLSPAARALALALHAAHHGELRAKPLVDLRRGIQRLEPPVWAQAVEVATALGAREGLSAGLALVPEDGVRLRDELGLEPANRERVVVRPAIWSQPAVTEGLLRLGDAPGIGAKLALLRSEAFPSATFMREYSSYKELARRGGFGLAVAYARRLFQLAHDLPSAISASRRFRRDRLATSGAGSENTSSEPAAGVRD